jgi:hypothetical protein
MHDNVAYFVISRKPGTSMATCLVAGLPGLNVRWVLSSDPHVRIKKTDV